MFDINLEKLITASMNVGLYPLRNKSELKELIKIYSRDQIFDYCETKKVIPFISGMMMEIGVDIDFWSTKLQYYHDRNMIIFKELDQIFQEFKNNNINKIFVSENFGAMLMGKCDRAFFASGDIDIYANISFKKDIYDVFKKKGYEINERYSGNDLIVSCFSNNSRLPEKFYFGINWHLLSRLFFPYLVDVERFVDWSTLNNHKIDSIMLPSPEALMYICLLHTSVHSFSRAPSIRLYRDIANICKEEINWNLIILWARNDCTCRRIAIAGILAKNLLGLPIPDKVTHLCEINKFRVFKQIYDSSNNILRKEPSSATVFKIEIYLNDKNIVYGLSSVLFPPRRWMKQVYSDSSIFNYIKHVLSFLRKKN